LAEIVSFFAGHPWLFAEICIAEAVWIMAFLPIFKSPKFRTKWKWVILNCVAFFWSFQIGPRETLGLGIPLGSLYVLCYWAFGKPRPKHTNSGNVETAALP
jgi:hypothetical protein